jgi:RHS repeat-associated protein
MSKSLGSVTSLSSTTSALSNTYTYDAFGNLVTSTGSLGNSLQYTGRESDPETGLRYYRARYYSSDVGRFINEDPLGFNGGVNYYDYVENNPTGHIDPFGVQANPDSTFCKRLLDKINNVQKKINERLGELDEDPQTLPETCPGDDVKPSLSRRGHRRLINMDKALLVALKALYLAKCSQNPPGGPAPVPLPVLVPVPDNIFDRKYWERVTGLTSAALIAYLIISEGSRLYPPRNLVPVP